MSDSRPDAGSTEEREAAEARPRNMIVRYSAFSRIRHWSIAIAWVLAALSGLALFHPALFGLSGLFGGGPWTRVLHPIFGLLMVVPFLFLAAAAAEHNRMRPGDWAWLRQYRDVVSNREDRLPEVGVYNAGQKLVFYSSLVCVVGLLLTGLPIWRAYFSTYFPIGLIRLASVVHAVCALTLICVILVHIYAAIWVKGSIRAMTRGWVSPGWAWKHHRAWFREVTKSAHPK